MLHLILEHGFNLTHGKQFSQLKKKKERETLLSTMRRQPCFYKDYTNVSCNSLPISTFSIRYPHLSLKSSLAPIVRQGTSEQVISPHRSSDVTSLTDGKRVNQTPAELMNFQRWAQP